MLINYISNEDLNITSGGWSGINANIFRQIKKTHPDINYIGPIKPSFSSLSEKIISKLLRITGLRGKFCFYSDNRLSNIENLVSDRLMRSDYNFFFSQTPWIKCNYDIPYGTYMDASFLTYLEIFSKPNHFIKKDIMRIAKAEEAWLQKAKHIFIGSQWAWDEMIKHYSLEEKQKVVVKTGGNIEQFEKDLYNQGIHFVFISLNFIKKGGFLCVEVFKKIRKKYPDATLTIIGQKPPYKILKEKGIIYAGLLKKNVLEDANVFKKILSEAYFLIHPTTMDTMGAVLIEAGYYGCPSIAPKSFGIPELIINNKTGILVDTPFSIESFSTPLFTILDDKNKYNKMRKEVWNFTRNELTWDAIGNKINSHINKI